MALTLCPCSGSTAPVEDPCRESTLWGEARNAALTVSPMVRCVTVVAPTAAKRQAENNPWVCGDRGPRHFKGKRDVNMHKPWPTYSLSKL